MHLHCGLRDALSELLPRERLEAARLTTWVERLIPEPRFQQALLAADVVEQVCVCVWVCPCLLVWSSLCAGVGVPGRLVDTALPSCQSPPAGRHLRKPQKLKGVCLPAPVSLPAWPSCQSEADSASSHRGAGDDESRSSSPEPARRSPLCVGLIGVGRWRADTQIPETCWCERWNEYLRLCA